MKLFKKKNWAYYLFSIISGVVCGVVFTILWWFIDQGHEQIKSAAKEDEAERKRKE